MYLFDMLYWSLLFWVQREKPDGNVNKLADIELSNDDDAKTNDDEPSNDDETNDDASVQRPSRERRPPDRFGEWATVASEELQSQLL